MSKRIRGGRGYLEIDNRASGGNLLKFDTLTCAHCNSMYALNPYRKRKRGWCRKCNAYVCDLPGCQTDCNPILQGVDLAQKYPGLPTLPRGYKGEILFDKYFAEKEKPFSGLTIPTQKQGD